MKSISGLLLLLVATALPLLAAAKGRPTPGAPVAITEIDEHVQDVGAFAVSEYNKGAPSPLTFEGVLGGTTRVVEGVVYHLFIVADGQNGMAKYEVVVFEKQWDHFRQLTSFKYLHD